MSVRCSSTAHHQDLVISIDFGINPRLPLRLSVEPGFVRPAISVGTIHNRQSAADKAAAINLTKTCLQSGGTARNIQGSQPVLVGSISQLTATYWLNTGMRTLGSASTGC